ncbi:hypothetical protein KYC5002_30015 [Archangium violaceum]|uniref:hypothetical protein n=1 Tax=Archangium violaceum TaxID=83451 RepID=UPI002B2D2038|nr:hypothetical protein KYC5002_30015 [Archangium gephyra]
MCLLGPGSSGSSSGLIIEAILALVLVSACAGVDAALVDGECDQTDSTVSCCLKQNPGQYERCTATPPAHSEPINVGLPELHVSENGDEQSSREDNEESREDREKRCVDYYARCIEEIGQKPGSLYGTTQCRDCFLYCSRHGFWPERVNKKKCPGA